MAPNNQTQGNWEEHPNTHELKQLIGKLEEHIHHHKETITHLEEIVIVQRPLIQSLNTEKQTLHETIKGLEAKLAGFTKAQLVRTLTDAEKNSVYSFGSVIKAFNE